MKFLHLSPLLAVRIFFEDENYDFTLREPSGDKYFNGKNNDRIVDRVWCQFSATYITLKDLSRAQLLAEFGALSGKNVFRTSDRTTSKFLRGKRLLINFVNETLINESLQKHRKIRPSIDQIRPGSLLL